MKVGKERGDRVKGEREREEKGKLRRPREKGLL